MIFYISAIGDAATKQQYKVVSNGKVAVDKSQYQGNGFGRWMAQNQISFICTEYFCFMVTFN